MNSEEPTVIGVLALEMRGYDEVVLQADPHILIGPGPDYDTGVTLGFGTPGLGLGEVTYTIGEWDDLAHAYHTTRNGPEPR